MALEEFDYLADDEDEEENSPYSLFSDVGATPSPVQGLSNLDLSYGRLGLLEGQQDKVTAKTAERADALKAYKSLTSNDEPLDSGKLSATALTTLLPLLLGVAMHGRGGLGYGAAAGGAGGLTFLKGEEDKRKEEREIAKEEYKSISDELGESRKSVLSTQDKLLSEGFQLGKARELAAARGGKEGGKDRDPATVAALVKASKGEKLTDDELALVYQDSTTTNNFLDTLGEDRRGLNQQIDISEREIDPSAFTAPPGKYLRGVTAEKINAEVGNTRKLLYSLDEAGDIIKRKGTGNLEGGDVKLLVAITNEIQNSYRIRNNLGARIEGAERGMLKSFSPDALASNGVWSFLVSETFQRNPDHYIPLLKNFIKTTHQIDVYSKSRGYLPTDPTPSFNKWLKDTVINPMKQKRAK